MTKNLKYIALCLFVTLLAIACSKDGADGNDVSKPNEAKKEIGIKPDVWKMAEATRATTYDNTTLQSGGFTVYAYKAGESTTEYAYINNKTVSYSASSWTIADGPYYWPAYHLDFFAYAPNSGSCITGPTYSYSGGQHVAFTCTGLAVTSDGQSSITEFVYALAANQNKEDHGATGVALSFVHPFSLVKLELPAGHPNITINSITFQTVKNGGTYNNGWTSVTGNENLVWTINAAFDNNTSAQLIGAPFLVVPQGWTGVIVVNADCLFWGEKVNYPSLTTTVPTTWEAGKSYIYTFNISPDDLKVETKSTFTEQW